ncbi:hypothetical protein MHYP_G00273220 [Metynnis hypsauchen]
MNHHELALTRSLGLLFKLLRSDVARGDKTNRLMATASGQPLSLATSRKLLPALSSTLVFSPLEECRVGYGQSMSSAE